MDLTDEQWAVIEPLVPEEERQPRGPGRPWCPARAVMNGILWILYMGARWQDLLDR
jgi:transposase